MENTYNESMKVMSELFGKDYHFAMATAKDNIPSVRFVDTFFEDGIFYIVTYSNSQKVKDITENSQVSFSRNFHRFNGKAYNIGHPLLPENKEIRSKLIKVFEPWYFEHNNEAHENMCFVKVELEDGFFYKNNVGYKVNFLDKTAKKTEVFYGDEEMTM